MPFNTPIAITVFNRPDFVQTLVDALKPIKPTKLYIISDYGRTKDEQAKIQLSQKIVESVTWKCTIKTNYSNINLGPRKCLAQGLTWFFNQEESGIVLEHDCIPHPDFFSYCSLLLDRYRDNKKIMHISGNNFLFEKIRVDNSYYFSKIPHIWGWASWSRAWKNYDEAMTDYPKFTANHTIKTIFSDALQRKVWTELFDQTYANKIQTWDYQWTYALLKLNGLAINPRVNLVKNIGFHTEAQNTTNSKSKFANMNTYPLIIDSHPSVLEPYAQADRLIMQQNFRAGYLSYYGYKLAKPYRWFNYSTHYYLKKMFLK